jgi:hypothetical protein
MVAENLEEDFTVFQFLQYEACLRVCHFLHLLYLVINYVISCLLYNVRRIVKLLSLLRLV